MSGDCDDADPDRSPGATDVPDDGIRIKTVMVIDATEETDEPSPEPSSEASARRLDADTGEGKMSAEDDVDR